MEAIRLEEKSGVTDEKGHKLDSNASSDPDKPALLFSKGW